MVFYTNEGKNVDIETSLGTFSRHAVKTRFVKEGDSLEDIIREYAKKSCEKGDILSISEKIVSICQGRIVKKAEVEPRFLAKFLSRFASVSEHGCGVSNEYKMQYAINTAGRLRIIVAAALGGACKLFGIKGVFYMIAGKAVSTLDGFYGKVWEEYANIGIEIPENPDGVCAEIENALGISCMIVDSNDLGREILGKSPHIGYDDKILKQMIRDNPAGQNKELTPIIIIRKRC